MKINLKGRSLLKLLDFSTEEIEYLLKLSHKLKKQNHSGNYKPVHLGKSVALLFQKDSTRTRCAFEVGAANLGMHTVYLGPSGTHFGKKESVIDTAKVLGRMFDGIQFRGYKQSDAEILAKYSGVPVWNGLTDDYHPTQVLADFLTIQEHCRLDLKGIRFVYIGDARSNTANSLMVGAAKMGMHFIVVGPKELWPHQDLVTKCEKIAKTTGATIKLTEDKSAGVKNADVIYTDIWVSMGESDWSGRLKLLHEYQVDMQTIKKAKSSVIFLHCLPSFHNMETTIGAEKAREYGKRFPRISKGEFEVTNEVFYSAHSVVFDEAENRLHTIEAVMLATLGEKV